MSDATGESLRLACLQVTSGTDPAANLEMLSDNVRRAAAQGARLIACPEMAGMMQQRTEPLFENSRPEAEDVVLAGLRRLSNELGVWQLIGSLPIRLEEKRKVANRSFLIDDSGGIAAHYDKLHMFDVDLPGGESYRESKMFQPGDHATVADTPWGKLGLSVCYDMRFGYLYRALAQAGARLIAVPSAFTRPTGRAHWHVLLRARAIENGCFVFAPAQCGEHEDGRKTYGHSLIVGPWGEILAEAGERPEIITADLDLGEVEAVRGRIPSLKHDRSFKEPDD